MSRYRKSLIGLLGFVVTVLATALAVAPEVIPIDALPYVNIIIAVATIYGIYRAPNTPPAGEPADPAVSEVGPFPG